MQCFCSCSVLSQQTVGVIVRMEKETFKVLNQYGKELSVAQHAVQPRKSRAIALDYHQVSLCVFVINALVL